MKNILRSLVLFFCLWVTTAEAANYAGTTAIFQIMSGATAANANGAFFNPANANFPTDGAATSATGSAAVFSSASYNFVAGDVGAWVYIKSGSNWNANCWYQIASVASNKATLSSGANQGICQSSVTNNFGQQSAAGVASTGSPTSATWGIDYSQQNTAQFTASTASGTTTAFTDSTFTPGKNWIGNSIHMTTGTGVTVGWYECANISGSNCTLDRTAGSSYSSVTYYMGGAASLGSSTTNQTDVLLFAQGGIATTVTNRWFIQGGSSVTYSIPQTVTLQNSFTSAPTIYEGYASFRGDRPSGATRPTLSMGANVLTGSQADQLYSLQITGNGTSVVSWSSYSLIDTCSVINNSPTANRSAILFTSIYDLIRNSEVVSERGYAINEVTNTDNNQQYIGNYIHDSNVCLYEYQGPSVVQNNIFSGCVTYAIQNTSSAIEVLYENNTFYGAENKLGTGLYLTTANLGRSSVINNIFYGLTTGYNSVVSQYIFSVYNNDWYNNTTDVTGAYKGPGDIAVNPTFKSVAQVTGTTATSATNVLTDSGKNFTTAGVVAGRDYVYVSAATGGTLGVYGITAVGTTTITLDNTIGTASAITYQITTGRNWNQTGLAQTTGFPQLYPASNNNLTNGNLAIGASQPAGGGGAAAYAWAQ